MQQFDETLLDDIARCFMRAAVEAWLAEQQHLDADDERQEAEAELAD